METIKAINQCSAEVMFFVLTIAATAWCSVGIVEAIKFAVREWFTPAKPAAEAEALTDAKD
jgi:hypothetical protein